MNIFGRPPSRNSNGSEANRPANTSDGGDSVADGAAGTMPRDDDAIVSVNAQSVAKGNRAAKATFIVVSGALVIGALALFGQSWLTNAKNSARGALGQRGQEERQDLANPEASKRTGSAPKVGAAGQRLGVVGAGTPTAAASPAGEKPCNFTPGGRLLRGKDGKVVTNPQGRALCIDAQGNVIEIPAIEPIATDKKPANAAGEAPPRSRFGGALFVSDASGKPAGGSQSAGQSQDARNDAGQRSSGQYQERRTGGANLDPLERALQIAAQGGGNAPPPGSAGGQGNRPADAAPNGYTAPPASAQQPSGSVGSGLVSSSTPVSRARRVPEMNLMLPKGRQADCVLTTRIINEVSGFASCALTQNLYSANGRVLLLERGAELSGEYGTNQAPNGQRRLFMVWNRVMTPDGIEIDLSSPGTDPLGTSGVPGYLEQRWFERIGGALLLSVMKDVVQYETAKQLSSRSTGTTVFAGQPPGQATIDQGQRIVEEVLKQTINIRPTLYINEGERIAIYVARDLDFTPVYSLRLAGAKGSATVK